MVHMVVSQQYVSDLSFTVPKAKSCLDKMTFHYMGGVQYEAVYLRECLDVDWSTQSHCLEGLEGTGRQFGADEPSLAIVL